MENNDRKEHYFGFEQSFVQICSFDQLSFAELLKVNIDKANFYSWLIWGKKNAIELNVVD